MAGVDFGILPRHDAHVELVHEQPGYKPVLPVSSVNRPEMFKAVYAHVVEELQKPFHLDVLGAPHELRRPDDAQRVGRVVDQVAGRVCRVDQASDLERHHGNVDREVLLPGVDLRGIDADEPDEQDTLDADRDEEVHGHYHYNHCRRHRSDERCIYLRGALDSGPRGKRRGQKTTATHDHVNVHDLQSQPEDDG